MDNNNINSEIFESNGSVNISDEVISVLASLATSEVKGVCGMVSGVALGFAELLGKKNPAKGIKINRSEEGLTIDVALIVEYGAKIPKVANEVQEKVKCEVETMTGLTVLTVNVSVDSVNVPAPEEAPEVKEEPEAEAVSETEEAE